MSISILDQGLVCGFIYILRNGDRSVFNLYELNSPPLGGCRKRIQNFTLSDLKIYEQPRKVPRLDDRQFDLFSDLRRRGLVVVRCEFALHAMAYNLARAVALLRGHRCPFLRDLPGAVYPVFLRPTGPRTTHCLKVLILQSSDEDKHRRIQKEF